MRILHLDPDDMDNPLSGGGPIRTFEICRRIAPRHQITILTPTFEGSTDTKEREGIQYRRLGRRIGDHGSSHHITFFFALPRAIRQYDYDLLVEDFMPPCSATLNPLFAKKPLVASIQWFFARTLAERYKIPFHWGERSLVKLYRHFVVLTETMKHRIEGWNRRARCRIIPNGVDEPLFGLPIEIGDFVLYLGRVDFAQKGVDLLLEAYARVSPSLRRPLVFAGHGYEWPRFEAMVKQLGLEGCVRAVGKVDARQREDLLRRCRFTCVPSRDETFGMVITESCAAGKPVVLWDQAPMNEVSAPGVCELARPFEIGSLTDRMTELLNESDDQIRRRGEECRRWAQQYRWDDLALRQEEFYLEAIDDHKVGSRRHFVMRSS